MPENPTISVITICRNAASLMTATMRSVLDQSYPHVEYIIVDGRSSDETMTVVDQISAEYPGRSIKVISEPDDGIADAMNKGVRLANGRLIIHLHAGDRFIDPTVLERVAQSHRETGWRWAVAGSVVVNAEGQQTHVYVGNPDYRTLLIKNCIPHQSTFLDKDIFETHGYFDISYKQAMDYEFWLRIVFKGGERYVVLPFNTSYFLDGGRSANIFELLRYLARLRKALHHYECKTNLMSDWVFLSRVLCFHYYYGFKKRLMGL